MTRILWVALAGLMLLAGCGAESPPSAEGGVDLSRFWNSDE